MIFAPPMRRTALSLPAPDGAIRLLRELRVFATLVLNVGHAIATGLWLVTLPGAGNPGSAPCRYGAWGVGAGTTSATDVGLFSEDSGGSPAYARIVGTVTQVTTTITNDTWQNVFTIVSNGSKTITNAGCADASTAGNFLLKGDFAGIPLTSLQGIQFTGSVQTI